ncbi:solute carrier family 12 member 6-like isoform X1 [Sesbania bispinosa]|nr:solute carrier family 12 member 6-like isoform X1 [Sesbania bispinosa]
MSSHCPFTPSPHNNHKTLKNISPIQIKTARKREEREGRSHRSPPLFSSLSFPNHPASVCQLVNPTDHGHRRRDSHCSQKLSSRDARSGDIPISASRPLSMCHYAHMPLKEARSVWWLLAKEIEEEKGENWVEDIHVSLTVWALEHKSERVRELLNPEREH